MVGGRRERNFGFVSRRTNKNDVFPVSGLTVRRAETTLRGEGEGSSAWRNTTPPPPRIKFNIGGCDTGKIHYTDDLCKGWGGGIVVEEGGETWTGIFFFFVVMMEEGENERPLKSGELEIEVVNRRPLLPSAPGGEVLF